MRFGKDLGDPIGVTLIEALVKNEHVLYIWKSLSQSLAKLHTRGSRKEVAVYKKKISFQLRSDYNDRQNLPKKLEQ